MNFIKSEKLKSFMTEKKSYVYLIMIFVTGLFLLIVFKSVPSENNSNIFDAGKYETDTYNSDEKRMEKILSEIDGVGECSVMIVKNDKFDNARTGFLSDNTKTIGQTYNGVIIVCEGGDNEELMFKIRRAVSSALSVPIYKVEILKKIGGI